MCACEEIFVYTVEHNNGNFALHTVGFYLSHPTPCPVNFQLLPHKQAKGEGVHQITSSSKIEGSFEIMLFVL